MIKKMVKLTLGDLGLLCSLLAGVFLLTHLVTAALLLFAGSRSSLLLSATILPITSGLFLLIYSAIHTMHTFEDALRHSVTRRRALGGLLGLSVLQGAAALALTVLLSWLERLFAPPLWMALSGASGCEVGSHGWVVGTYGTGDTFFLFIERIAIPWWIILLIPLVCTLAGIIAGALIQRFGRTAGWILWGVWIVFLIFQSVIPWEQLFSTHWLLPFCAAALAALSIWAFWSLLHAVVRR